MLDSVDSLDYIALSSTPCFLHSLFLLYCSENMSEKVHIVGIGGVGMSAIAQAMLDSGVAVSGSDRLLDTGDTTPVLECLRKQGVSLFPQDGSGVDSSVTRVVISTAIEDVAVLKM